MLRSLMTAASGMKAQQLQVDTIANNIANAGTTGFKKNRLSFQSTFYQTFRQPGAPIGQGQLDATGLQVGSGTEISGSAMVMAQGGVEETGRPMDLAIQGSGFFEVQLPNGESRFTRDGAFRRSSNGDIVTAEGYFLVPRVTLPNGVSEIQVGNSGEVSYMDDTGTLQGGQTILLARFANPMGLRAEGGNLMAETPSSGPAQRQTPGVSGTGTVTSGALERSNVETVDELVGLIVAQRNYEVNSRAIQVSDEMLQVVYQLIR
ncbi:MAG: flagellar basal-body rod protein FlgG [Planctomycetota bacterium]|jgi:flagellar basal-body rod protein FlgG